MCNFDAEDILAGNECHKEGGLLGIAYYAFAEDILVWPTLPAIPADFAASATLEGDFVMKPGKYFSMLESELEMSEYKGEGQGIVSSLSATGRHTFRQVAPSEQLAGFVNACKNRRVALVFEGYDGKRRLLGKQSWPARMASFEEGTGQKLADDRYITFVMDAGGALPFYYEGDLPLAPEEIAIIDEFGEDIIDEFGENIIE
jgi:hypothetical protein